MQGQEESASHMWSRCQGWEDGSKVVSSHEYRNSQGIIKLLGLHGPSDFLFRITPFFLFWFWGGVGSMVAHTCCPSTTKGGLSYQFQESLAIQYHTRKEEKMSLCLLVFQNHDHSSVWVLQKPKMRIFSYTLQLKRKKERKRPIMTVGNRTAPDTYWVYQVSGTVGRVLPPLCVLLRTRLRFSLLI